MTVSEDATKKVSSERWPVLFLGCWTLVGSYYCFDIPSALKPQIDGYFGYDDGYETKFSLLYTVYALPNIIVPFFGGFLVNWFGIVTNVVVQTALIALGHVIFSVGIARGSWEYILLGRFVFGIGGECLTVATCALFAEWFGGGELAFAFGISFSVSKLGGVVNNVVSPVLADRMGVPLSCWAGGVVCLVSILSALLIVPIDLSVVRSARRRAFLLRNQQPKQQTMNLRPSQYSSSQRQLQERQQRERVDQHDCAPQFPLATLLPSYEDVDSTASSSSESLSSSPIADLEPVHPFRWSTPMVTTMRDIASHYSYPPNNLIQQSGVKISKRVESVAKEPIPTLFWVIAAVCFIVYGCVLPFNNISASLLLERDYFRAPPFGCELTDPFQCQSARNPPNELCGTSAYYQPPLPANVTVGTTHYSDDILFSDIDCNSGIWNSNVALDSSQLSQYSVLENIGCTTVFCQRRRDAEYVTSLVMSLPYVVSGVTAPFFGLLIDRVGLRAIIFFLASVLIAAVHSVLARCSEVGPILPLLAQGVAYTGFASVLYPSIPLVVQKHQVSLCYGAITSLQNFACALFPVVIALLFEANSRKYLPTVEWLFALLGLLAAMVSVLMNVLDAVGEGKLNGRPLHVNREEDKHPDFDEDKEDANNNIS